MGAVPKNKITRAERGKRRQGNRPTITKDTNNTSIPLHKRGMVAEFLKLMGIASDKQTSAKPKKQTAKKAAKPKKASKTAKKSTAATKIEPKKTIKKSTSSKSQTSSRSKKSTKK